MPRRLRVLVVALALGAVAAGGSAALPGRPQDGGQQRSSRNIVPGFGGPVSEQASGELPVKPLPEWEVAEVQPGSTEVPAAPKRVQGSFIVALAPGQDPSATAAAIARDYGGEAGAVYDSVINGFQFVGPDDAGTRMARDPRISSVQPDFEAHVAESSASVHLAAINQPAAVNNGHGGQGVRVGILDTGADFNHSDLAGRLAPDSTNASGGKCDGTGGRPDDFNGHGTRTTSNALGLIGVAPDAIGVIVKVFPSGTSTTFAHIACGVNYLVRLNNDGNTANDVKVVNASIAGASGTGSCTDGGLRQAVCQLVNPQLHGKPPSTPGAVFFAAAGNSARSASSYAPGNYPEVIAVSAFDCNSGCLSPVKPKLASFSNRGSKVGLGAPGVAIVSSRRGGGRETASGTSRAAPQAAGAAADILSASPGLSPSAIRTALLTAGNCPDFAPNGTAGNCTHGGTWPSDPDGVTEPFLNVGRAITGGGPSASFVAPANGATVSGNPVNIVVSATTTSGSINSVSVAVDGSTLSGTTFDGTNYTTPWNTLSRADGPATIQATVNSTNGTVSISQVVRVENIDDAPTVVITSPANGATVAETFTISATASDDRDSPTASLVVGGGSPTPMSCAAGLTVTCTRSVTLAAGAHSLTVQSFDAHSHSSSPASISVTVSSGPPPTWTRVEQNGTGVTYTSGWTTYSSSCTSGGSYRASSVGGATARFTFTGVGVKVITAVGSNLGRAQILVDGVPHGEIDTYAAEQACRQPLFELTGLENREHTLEVRVLNAKNPASSGSHVIVDAFDKLA